MRSESHHPQQHGNPFINAIVQVVDDIAQAVFMLLGDLIASRTHTVKKSDHSEPPDVAKILQPV
jgi:hypothetical protein